MNFVHISAASSHRVSNLGGQGPVVVVIEVEGVQGARVELLLTWVGKQIKILQRRR